MLDLLVAGMGEGDNTGLSVGSLVKEIAVARAHGHHRRTRSGLKVRRGAWQGLACMHIKGMKLFVRRSEKSK